MLEDFQTDFPFAIPLVFLEKGPFCSATRTAQKKWGTWLGTRGSEVQILSPRPLASESLVFAPPRLGFGNIRLSPDFPRFPIRVPADKMTIGLGARYGKNR